MPKKLAFEWVKSGVQKTQKPAFVLPMFKHSFNMIRTEKLPVFGVYCAFVRKIKNGLNQVGTRGGVMVKALRYKPAGRGFDPRWCHWNYSVT